MVEPVATSGRADSVRRGSRWPLVVTGAAAALIAVTAVWFLTVPDAAVRGIARLHINMPPAEVFATANVRTIAITPDGRRIIFRATLDGLPHLYVRSLDDLDALPLRGLGDNPSIPFISPDGEWVGYFTSTELRKVSILGGPPLTVCVLPSAGRRGATWGPDDTIVFATIGTGLWQVSAGGGEPEPLTTPDNSRGVLNHTWPEFLPGGESVLFTIAGSQPENSQIAVLSLQDGTQTTLVPGGTDPHFTMSGHIVYGVAGTLRAVGFDLDQLEVTSNPFPVVDGVSTNAAGSAQFAVSREGSLLYMPGGVLASGLGQIPVWGRPCRSGGAIARFCPWQLRQREGVAGGYPAGRVQPGSGNRQRRLVDLRPGAGHAQPPDHRPGPGFESPLDPRWERRCLRVEPGRRGRAV